MERIKFASFHTSVLLLDGKWAVREQKLTHNLIDTPL